MRDTGAQADSWVRFMETGRYPPFTPVIDPDLRSSVARIARKKLADSRAQKKGSRATRPDPLRVFLERHALSIMVDEPSLSRERGDIIHSEKSKDALREKLDDWLVSVWERFPWQEGRLLP